MAGQGISLFAHFPYLIFIRIVTGPQTAELEWGGGRDSQYIVLSELLSDQAAFITSPKTSLANYWGGIVPLPPSAYGPECELSFVEDSF